MNWYDIQYLYCDSMELFCSTMFPNVGVPSISVLEFYDIKKLYSFFDKQGIYLTIEMYTKNNWSYTISLENEKMIITSKESKNKREEIEYDGFEECFRLLNKKLETMKEIKFYTVEEKNIIKQMLSTGETKRNIARKLAIQFNRSEYGIYQLLGKMRSSVSKVKPVKPLATIRDKKVLQNTKQEEALQRPADIGVEVPHGMTFEGTPKKIMLHSDHFRIYF